MIKNLLKTTLALLFIGNAALAQQGTGAIKGKISNAASKESVPFANVVAIIDGVTIGQGQSDFDGNYTIRPLKPGKYTLKASSVGFQTIQINGIIVGSDNSTFQNLDMVNSGVDLTTVIITEYKVPSISANGNSVKSVTKDDFQAMAAKDLTTVASTSSGVTRANDKSGELNIRGARSEGAFIYIDGERVIGAAAVPQGQVEQIDVITSGIPARYGNTTGGIINYTTSGASSRFRGGIEGVSSQITDPYKYNQVNGNLSGPLLKTTDADGTKRTLIGFNVGAQYTNVKDPSPSVIGAWKVNDDLLDSLRRKPQAQLQNTTQLGNSADFVTRNDLEHIKARPNVRSQSLLLNGRVEIAPTKNTLITVGGNYTGSKANDYNFSRMLFSPDRNPTSRDNTARGYIKFNQKFGAQAAENSSQNITNINLSAQLGYQVRKRSTMDETVGTNPFAYGYVGKFDTKQFKVFIPSFLDNLAGGTVAAPDYVSLSVDSFTKFSRDDRYNPYLANYTDNLYDIYNGGQFGITNNIFTVRANNGIINGDRPQNVNGLFSNIGFANTQVSKSENAQFRAFASLTAQLFKYHDVEVGGEFEQQNNRSYAVAGNGLWNRMRQLTNVQTENGSVDFTSATYVSTNSLGDIFELNPVYNPNSQTYFDKSLRTRLGITDPKQLIYIDNVDLDQLSLDLFSAEELLNPIGGQLVSYFGYDKDGNKIRDNFTISNFLDDKDADNNKLYRIGSFRPIYAAGYVQDKFEYKDLRFNLGFRLDYYNTLQNVLKDPYSIFPTKTVAEVSGLTDIPDNIGGDFIPYVSSIENPNAANVIGFRDPSSLFPGLWYDRAGKILQSPQDLARQTADGRIAPFLANPNQKKVFGDLTTESFTRYQAQYSPMPRLSFAFPISDVASFHAHYDVLYTRPNGNRFDIFDIFNLENVQAPFLENANLRPERTSDLEIGYSQILNENKSAGLELKAFYKDFNNQVEQVNLVGAYPKQYATYANSGFATSRGLTATFNLQRTGNFKMAINYTLQFSKGTSSNRNSSANFVNLGVPNLRNLTPLDFDQRHNLVSSIDYRYASGKNYNGPKINEKNILENFGINITSFIGSGVPYSKQSNPTPEVSIGAVNRSQLDGTINGSRQPWTYRFDARIEKLFTINYGENDEVKGRKHLDLNAYVLFQNILNNINIVNVYRYTGSVSDDGYISSTLAVPDINSRVSPNSYREMYAIRVNDPANYGLPRIIRLGLQVNF